MENEPLLTQDMKYEILDFMEIPRDCEIKFMPSFTDWNFYHSVFYKYSKLCTGKFAVDDELLTNCELIELATTTKHILDAFLIVGTAVTWYNNLFKKVKQKKDDKNKADTQHSGNVV